jgi:NADH-quinone oxidoreductase subunit N
MTLMDYISAAPEMTLLGLICVVLIADLFVDNEHRVLTFWMSMIALAITAWVVLATAPDGRAIVFDGSYVSDPLSQILKISAVGFVAIAFLYARDYLLANDLHKGEYYTLGLFGLLGMMIMISANSMLIMYLGVETLALSMYALVAIDRNNVTSAESAMKYFVLGAIASGALLYGISWVYGVTGTLKFDEIAIAVAANPALNGLPLWFGLAFLIVGIAFKFGAVPFHMWLPDVYQGARTPVTLYLASAPKLAALAFALRVLVDGLGGLHDVWADMILVVAVLSLLAGNVIAIAQSNIKRMLGYSTIAHVGFILLAIFVGTEKGNAAALFYTLTYIVAAAGAFGIVILLSRRGYDAENISDFKGVPDVQHGGNTAVYRLFRQIKRHRCRTKRRIHGPGRRDGSGLRGWRVLLPARDLVHVFRAGRRSGRLAGQHGHTAGSEPQRRRGFSPRNRPGLAMDALYANSLVIPLATQ